MSYVDWRAFFQATVANLTNPSIPARARVFDAVRVMEAEGEDATPTRIAERCDLPPRTTRTHLARLRNDGLVVSNSGVYVAAGNQPPVTAGNQPPRPETSRPETSRIGRPETSRLSVYKRSKIYPPTPLADPTASTSGKGTPVRLAGSDLDQGSAMPTGKAGLDDGTLAAAEAFERQMQAATVAIPVGPAGWFDGICREIGDRMPARRGHGNVRIEPLTQTHRNRIAAIIRERGGPEVFDAVIRPALLGANEIKSPAGFLAYLYGQHSAGQLQARPILDLPPFVNAALVEVYEGNVRDCCVAEASSIVGSNNPDRAHYHSAIGWVAQRAAEPDMATLIHRNHWQFDASTLGKAMATLENHGH